MCTGLEVLHDTAERKPDCHDFIGLLLTFCPCAGAPSARISGVRQPPVAPSRTLPGGACSAAGAYHLLGDVR